MSNHPQRRQGFTIVEMAIVLLIIGLALGMVLTTSRGMLDSQKRTLVQTQLATIDTALANFVAANKRLPCPADGAIASGAVGAGIETATCTAAQQNRGVVPWVTLGIAESDATDPWFGRMTYRVDPVLVVSGNMDMTPCDPAATGGAVGGICKPAGTGCAGNAGCTSPTSFLTGKGLDVWDGANGNAGWLTRPNIRTGTTGAAYVVISHGPTGAGAYNKGGAGAPYATQPGTLSIPNPSPPPAVLNYGTDEQFNLNNTALYTSSTQATTYRDAPLNDIVSNAHFDDYLSHPTIMSVLQKANLGPRAH